MKKLTLEMLEKIEPGTIFASGTAEDSSTGIYMTNSLNPLRWVAVKGQVNDWAIYFGHIDTTEDFLKEHGNKVHNSGTVRRLVNCTNEAFDNYRV